MLHLIKKNGGGQVKAEGAAGAPPPSKRSQRCGPAMAGRLPHTCSLTRLATP